MPKMNSEDKAVVWIVGMIFGIPALAGVLVAIFGK